MREFAAAVVAAALVGGLLAPHDPGATVTAAWVASGGSAWLGIAGLGVVGAMGGGVVGLR